MNTYIFKVELTKEDDGRWSAVVPALPGCNAWADTEEMVLRAIQSVHWLPIMSPFCGFQKGRITPTILFENPIRVQSD